MKPIYLDHAAATPLEPSVLTVMQPYFSDKFYNPSALYGAAQSVARDLADARATVAGLLGARPIEITFTAGGTEANNLAIAGVMTAFPDKKVLISAIEHDSVLETARQYDYDLVPVTEQGITDVAALEKVIDDSTVLVSIMYANNEIGTIQPIREVTQLVSRIRRARKAAGNDLPLYVHSDAAQAANYLDIHVSRLGVDLLSLNGGKLYGPKQTGALYVRSGTRLKPLVRGGGQEHGLRSGTENVAGAVGFAEALRLAQELRPDETRRLQDLQRHFMQSLRQAIPEVVFNGSLKRRLPNNVHLTIPGIDNERLLYQLDEHGVLAAAGSACSASSEEASHVLQACGLTDDAARASLRFTMGRSTTESDIDTTVRILSELLAN
jgi:cysteine desulfurase